jgi:plasmid stabilization system protein ParE
MYDLIAIVRATRATARALADMQRLGRVIEDTYKPGKPYIHEVRAVAQRKHNAAYRRYRKAQAILAANPLPGDVA